MAQGGGVIMRLATQGLAEQLDSGYGLAVAEYTEHVYAGLGHREAHTVAGADCGSLGAYTSSNTTIVM